MKYIVVFIQGAIVAGAFNQPLPGTMIEVDRFSTLEMAQNEAKAFRSKYGHQGAVVIVPYYEVED